MKVKGDTVDTNLAELFYYYLSGPLQTLFNKYDISYGVFQSLFNEYRINYEVLRSILAAYIKNLNTPLHAFNAMTAPIFSSTAKETRTERRT